MDTLLAEAAELLAVTTNLNVTQTHNDGDNIQEADGRLTITYGQQKFTWGVETKKRLTRQILAKLTLVKTVFAKIAHLSNLSVDTANFTVTPYTFEKREKRRETLYCSLLNIVH